MKFFSKIIDGNISSINRICNMVCIEFTTKVGSQIYFHIQSFFRVKRGQKIIICSEDMYRRGQNSIKENFEWDIPGLSVYDDSVEYYLDLLTSSRITNVTKNDSGDLAISLENDLNMEILVDTTVTEEKYRLFDEAQEFVVES